jgi:NitT/TauT family transport system substrate-binding protein
MSGLGKPLDESAAAAGAPFDAARRGLLKTLSAAATVATPFWASGSAWAQQQAAPATAHQHGSPPAQQLAQAQAGKAKSLTPLSLAWSQVAYCHTFLAVAQENGIFTRHGLDVTFVNYAGSAEQFLETLATGKVSASVGMIHRWLKPLEAGFDVKIVAGLHGGCERLIAYKPTGITKVADLRGKIIGVPNLSDPGKHFFSSYLKRNGVDPDRDVQWRVYQADLMGVAAEKGEIHAIAAGDPTLYRIEKASKAGYVELATNTSPPYHDKTCCVLGVGGAFLRRDRPTVAALARSLIEALEFTAAKPEESARIFHKYTTGLSLDELLSFYKQLTPHNHPTGASLREQLTFYAQDFKDLGVLKASTDPQRFVAHITDDVLGNS